jgi:hypothetical protein
VHVVSIVIRHRNNKSIEKDANKKAIAPLMTQAMTLQGNDPYHDQQTNVRIAHYLYRTIINKMSFQLHIDLNERNQVRSTNIYI